MKSKFLLSALFVVAQISNLWNKLFFSLFFYRKSLKSLFFLLPLLGITNILHFLWPNPLRGSWQSFAVWSFISHFLYSFQGLFVASVYFLFDDKVINSLNSIWKNPLKICIFSGERHVVQILGPKFSITRLGQRSIRQ